MTRSYRPSGSGLNVALLPAVLALLLYAQVIDHDFISLDDGGYTYENPVVVQGITWQGIVWAFSDSHFANYHPLTWISHMIDYSVFGEAPGWFALENAVLHAINSLLVSLFLIHLFRNPWIGFMGGCIFAIHPAWVEAVAWISQRKTVCATLWFLLSAGLYWHAMQEGSAHRRRWMRVASVFCFGVSLLFKSMYVTLPVLLLLLECFREQEDRRRCKPGIGAIVRERWFPVFLRILPYAVWSAGFVVLALWSQERDGAVAAWVHHSLAERLRNALFGYVAYLLKFLYPDSLALFYPLELQPFGWMDWARASLLLGITIGLYGCRKLLGLQPLWGWLVFLILLLPVIGLVQIGAQSHADRYLYGPMIGLIGMACALGERMWAKVRTTRFRRLLEIALAVWLVFLGTVSLFQISKWQNEFSLAQSVLSNDADNPIAANLMANALMKHGHYQDASALLEQQISLYPNYALNYANLALCQFLLGNPEAAVRHQKHFVAMAPIRGAGMVNLAAFYDAMGNSELVEETIQQIREGQHELKSSELRILEKLESKDHAR